MTLLMVAIFIVIGGGRNPERGLQWRLQWGAPPRPLGQGWRVGPRVRQQVHLPGTGSNRRDRGNSVPSLAAVVETRSALGELPARVLVAQQVHRVHTLRCGHRTSLSFVGFSRLEGSRGAVPYPRKKPITGRSYRTSVDATNRTACPAGEGWQVRIIGACKPYLRHACHTATSATEKISYESSQRGRPCPARRERPICGQQRA